jgi:hypothetical protein
MSDGESRSDAVRFATIEASFRTARTVARTIGWCFAAYCAYLSIQAVAGQTTTLSVIMSFFFGAFLELKMVVLISLAGGCAIWALIERNLRQRAVARLTPRSAALEKVIDPGRTSSGLTSEGRTHPRDRGA